MKILKSLFVVLGGMLLAGHAVAQGGGEPAEENETVVVQMVDKGGATWRFEPAQVRIRPGDTLRFVQQDIVPHNVEFRGAPEKAELGEARMGPYLSSKGQTYDLVIDERFVPGTYRYVCTPHASMGMKGVFEVASPEERASAR